MRKILKYLILLKMEDVLICILQDLLIVAFSLLLVKMLVPGI